MDWPLGSLCLLHRRACGGFLPLLLLPVLLLLLTPSSGLSRLRCVIRTPGCQAGFLTLLIPYPAEPRAPRAFQHCPSGSQPLFSSSRPALEGSFLHVQEWGLGSDSSPVFGAEILGAGHLWVTPFLLQAGTGLLAFPAAGPSLSHVRHHHCLETFPFPCDLSPRTRA